MSNQIKLEQRTLLTSAARKQLRAEGKIPAVVYGESIDNATISVDQKQMSNILRTNPNAVLQMEVPEQGKHPVMIGEIQRDPISRDILHIDFLQIDVKNPIKVMVRIDILGEAVGSREGGVLQVPLTELEVECLPHLIPTSIPVDVSELSIGDSVLVSDITMPEGVEASTAAEEVIASVLAPQAEEEEEATDAEETDSDEESSESEESAETDEETE